MHNADLASLAPRAQHHLKEAAAGRAGNDGVTNRVANDKVTNGSGVKLTAKEDASDKVAKEGACVSPPVVAPSTIRAP